MFSQNYIVSSILVLVQFTCLALIALTGNLFPDNILLLLLEIAGIALGIWAILSMGIGKFGIRPEPLEKSVIITKGAYHWIRHPMYLALLLTTLPLVIADFCNTAISFDEIISGAYQSGDGRCCCCIDMAHRTVACDCRGLEGEARAYPQALLIWHEIANDEIADVPIAITFCPLCNSSIVFDRRVDGEILEFGVSGVLRNSDMVMYDRQTESWWQQ